MRRGFSVLAIVLTVLLGLFVSNLWYATVKSAELVGTYHCAYLYGTETLTLSPTGTYWQVFSFNSGNVVKNDGTWSLKANKKLQLFDAVVIDDGNGLPRQKFARGLWLMPVSRSLSGKPIIIANDDLGLVFR